MLNVIICGAAGRMGRANISVFNESKAVRIVGAIEAGDSKYIGQDAGSIAGIEKIDVPITADLEVLIQKGDVVVDFTNRDASLNNLNIVERYNKAIVIGTTGFNAEQVLKVKEYSKNIPVLLSPNMSVGVNTLFYLVRRASELLGEDFDVEIFEIHHNRKKDAPSGTALQFAKVIAEARGKKLNDIAVYGRNGLIGERRKGEIGILALRLADVVGDHTIIFGGTGERIEFSHRNSSRKTFASGALKAALFITKKEKGFFTMADVLGLQ